MSEPGKKTQDFSHPVNENLTQHEIAADEAGATGKAEREIVAEESSHADAEAKAEAKHVPPDIISKSQRKRL
jgi:hypothetical protein